MSIVADLVSLSKMFKTINIHFKCMLFYFAVIIAGNVENKKHLRNYFVYSRILYYNIISTADYGPSVKHKPSPDEVLSMCKHHLEDPAIVNAMKQISVLFFLAYYT